MSRYKISIDFEVALDDPDGIRRGAAEHATWLRRVSGATAHAMDSSGTRYDERDFEDLVRSDSPAAVATVMQKAISY